VPITCASLGPGKFICAGSQEPKIIATHQSECALEISAGFRGDDRVGCTWGSPRLPKLSRWQAWSTMEVFRGAVLIQGSAILVEISSVGRKTKIRVRAEGLETI